jgi:hypothetical protein
MPLSVTSNSSRTRRDAFGHGFGKRARRERLGPQHQPSGVGARGIDDQRRQRGEMLGAALDGLRPLALARSEIGGGE